MRTLITVIACACCVVAALAQQADQQAAPSPEHRKLQLWAGEWTYEGESQATVLGPGGKFTGTMSGRSILNGFGLEIVFNERRPSGELQTIEVDTYDPVSRSYPAIAISSDGSLFQGSFTMNGNVATWEGTVVANGRRLSSRGTDAVAPDGMSIAMRGELSADGKTWVPAFQLKRTRVKAS